MRITGMRTSMRGDDRSPRSRCRAWNSPEDRQKEEWNGGIAEGETTSKNRMGRVGIPEIDEVMTGRRSRVKMNHESIFEMIESHVGAIEVL